jgi:hypothetical protein
MNCADCRFYDPHTKDRGSCRRYPPQWSIEVCSGPYRADDLRDLGAVSMFPSVDAEDWCGEHTEKSEEKA